MPSLENILGSDDSSNNNIESNDLNGIIDLNSTLDTDADSSQSSYNQDEEGNISALQSDNSFGLDTSTDGLLQGVSGAARRLRLIWRRFEHRDPPAQSTASCNSHVTGL